MNLKMFNGKVPIFHDGQVHLVDFPAREVFDTIFARSPAQNRDQYWIVLNARAKGNTLEHSGSPYGYSRERVRAIEAKFLRRMTSMFASKTDSL